MNPFSQKKFKVPNPKRNIKYSCFACKKVINITSKSELKCKFCGGDIFLKKRNKYKEGQFIDCK